MKRLHVHAAVENMTACVRLYSALFAAEPAVLRPECAKWLLADPRVNLAISQRGAIPGIEQLGIQVVNRPELEEVYARPKRAERPVLEEGNTTFCYAQREQSWIADPQGVLWETFLRSDESTVYGRDTILAATPVKSARCVRNEDPGVADGRAEGSGR